MAYIEEAVNSGKISGNGIFTNKCHQFLEEKYNINKCLLTTSCTDALEMSAILLDITEGDEVILPSYTFVSTANAFLIRGAKLIFADSYYDNPNIDASKLEQLITPKTKAIVLVHYAGVACDLDLIMALANKYNLYVIEDAAQAIDASYNQKPLGSIGHLAAFSFHETKNLIAGEGGALMINTPKFAKRSEIIWEKGTNRTSFYRGEVEKYGWVDIGSSFLPSEIMAAFLYAQLEKMQMIQNTRMNIWEKYNQELSTLQKQGIVYLPTIPKYATHNAHLFYLICNSINERQNLINHLWQKGVNAVFHYLPLHLSPFFKNRYSGDPLPNSVRFGECLVRLPLFYELTDSQQAHIIREVKHFYS